jgi:nitroreductase
MRRLQMHRDRIPSAKEFPYFASPRDQLLFCLQYAVLAPSIHNTQPWRFRVGDEEVELWVDAERALPVVDPLGRERVISCGAALANLCIAVEVFGHATEVTLLPDPKRASLLARLAPGEKVSAAPETTLLFHAIPYRRTNRKAFEEWPVPADVVRLLQDAALDEGAWLVPLESDRKIALADLVAEADRAQLEDASFRSELAAWRSTMASFGDPEAADPRIVRTFEWEPTSRAARDRELALGSPILAVLGTGEDDVRGWLRAGLALERVLLRASAMGLQASYLNQPIEMSAFRPRLREIVGCGGHPQLVLRVGYGPKIRATPRRALEDVLLD